VNDEASAELVVEFYRHLLTSPVSRAEALRRAQRTLIEDHRYRHPGYWAPFLLISSWL
jgi:CHAT domain-containing protein